eukprot:PhF_6_TR19634/c0_g1_i1/m.28648
MNPFHLSLFCDFNVRVVPPAPQHDHPILSNIVDDVTVSILSYLDPSTLWTVSLTSRRLFEIICTSTSLPAHPPCVIAQHYSAEISSPGLPGNMFTFDCYVNLSNSPWFHRIVGEENSFAFGVREDKMVFTIFNVRDYYSPPGTIQTNVWHHLIYGFDNAGQVLFYCDGVRIPITGGVCGMANEKIQCAGNRVFVGGVANGRGEFWDGKLAMVRLWNGIPNDASAAVIHKQVVQAMNTQGLVHQLSACSEVPSTLQVLRCWTPSCVPKSSLIQCRWYESVQKQLCSTINSKIYVNRFGKRSRRTV